VERNNPKHSINHESEWWKDLRKVCGTDFEKYWFEKNIVWHMGKA